MLSIGIDPGLSGGMALLDDSAVVEVHDIPTRGSGAQHYVNAAAICRFIEDSGALMVTLESVSAMPGQGVASMFRFGRAVGAIMGAIETSPAALFMVTPASWKRNLNVSSHKDGARARAIDLFGDQWFPLKKDHNKAEAALLAFYGLTHHPVAQMQEAQRI